MPTIEEAKKRIAEIKRQRDELRGEQDKLEKLISDDSQAKKLAARKEYEGKYFLLANENIPSSHKGIIGFKVLTVNSNNPMSHAECIVLLRQHYRNAYPETGIIKQQLWLWAPATERVRMRLREEPNLIEYYKEVTKEEFLEAAAAHSLIDEI